MGIGLIEYSIYIRAASIAFLLKLTIKTLKTDFEKSSIKIKFKF